MEKPNFSLRESIVSVAWIAVAVWLFYNMSSHALNYDEMNPGRLATKNNVAFACFVS